MRPGDVRLVRADGPANDEAGRRGGIAHDDDPERERASLEVSLGSDRLARGGGAV
jgi:hypothetical protein